MPDTMKGKTVLVTGATGYIGRRLTHRLLETSALNVRVLMRNKKKVQVSIVNLVEIKEASTFDKEPFAAAVAGVDTAEPLAKVSRSVVTVSTPSI